MKPLTQKQILDEYFIEYRTKLLDLAAFLDRFERANIKDAEHDFRIVALEKSLRELTKHDLHRTETIQMVLSDTSLEPKDSLDRKSAYGAAR